ncbi:FAD/NAD(P)-binding domain-containing protein [Aspergillus saccharolyticus JOP 1030-1]|uniref:FAD/NAD(P)-binding domain-containing protein n=1 Tax=Aspergillus saccharolyticus JOP 1030-1 TaxID=1450539 RepID=A0A318ZKW8_9EURO|nr:FAD/NAD(P)-binding domain-containing protein [Aspergillus saccharolyticus JOP 1030-1]PYH47507.1 FAD/NAD(P)-binding domain-containing protein [Aspergillus saccharolyticus JOP 1030-1]
MAQLDNRVPGHNDATYDTVPENDQIFKIEFLEIATTPIIAAFDSDCPRVALPARVAVNQGLPLLDPPPYFLVAAAKPPTGPSSRFSFTVSRGEDLSAQYPAASANLVVCTLVSPLLDTQAALQSIHHLLKPGAMLAIWFYGRVHFADPAAARCQRLLDAIVEHHSGVVIAADRAGWADMGFISRTSCGVGFPVEPAASRAGRHERVVKVEDCQLWRKEWTVGRAAPRLRRAYLPLCGGAGGGVAAGCRGSVGVYVACGAGAGVQEGGEGASRDARLPRASSNATQPWRSSFSKLNANTKTFRGLFLLLDSPLDWAYPTVPEPNTDSRFHTVHAGRALEEARWSNAGSLPYLRRAESWFDHQADPEQHGFALTGPFTSPHRADAMQRSNFRCASPSRRPGRRSGLPHNPNGGAGQLAGVSEFLETWHRGQRQAAYQAYSLENVQVLVGATVQRVEFAADNNNKKRTASRVVLTDSRRYAAHKEVILAAGALRTPQLLMLSGIGPAATLTQHAIPVARDVPEVDRNFHNHLANYQIYKLRNPERGLALGSPNLTDPAYMKGFPIDWAANLDVPAPVLADDASLFQPGRPLVESLVAYAPAGLPHIPFNGEYIMTSVMRLCSTSRIRHHRIRLRRLPVIHANYFDTEIDRVSLIHGSRRSMQALLDTTATRDYIEAEVPPPGMAALSSASSDREINARISAGGQAHHHPAGTAAAGKVVDPSLRVYGVQNLRVIDASILPVSIGGHPQATLYAVAEAATELILGV